MTGQSAYVSSLSDLTCLLVRFTVDSAFARIENHYFVNDVRIFLFFDIPSIRD